MTKTTTLDNYVHAIDDGKMPYTLVTVACVCLCAPVLCAAMRAFVCVVVGILSCCRL
jgi:hypothetical protein